MTIDAAEISRLRDYVKNGGRLHGDKAIALLDELEKAQAKAIEIWEISEHNAKTATKLHVELEKAQADGQRQYDYNVEQIAKFAAVEAERDHFQALLREAQGRFINLRDAIKSSVAKTVGVQICEEQIVRIAAELGDKP